MADADSNNAMLGVAIATLAIGIIAVIVAVTVPELRRAIGLDDAEEDLTCQERLTDDPNPPQDHEDRVRPPSALQLSFQRSTRLDGRLAARIEWSHPDLGIESGLISISGRRGEADPMDTPMRLNDDLPPPGTCGKWYREYEREGPEQTGWTVIVEGLWAGETYCFAVNAADSDGGITAPYPSISTESVCREAPWNESWGKADRP